MPSYTLSLDAESDLRSIAQYTLKRWGHSQLNKYRLELKQHFESIAAGTVRSRLYSDSLPQVYISKVGSHFVFHLASDQKAPIIIGVIHEKRDIVTHLNARLG